MKICEFLDTRHGHPKCGFRPRPEGVGNCLICNGVRDGADCPIEAACKAGILNMGKMLARFKTGYTENEE